MGGKKAKSRKSKFLNEKYLFIALFVFVTLVLVLLFFSLFTDNPEVNEVKKTNCFAAASKGKCDELSSEYGDEMRGECCTKYSKCCK